MPSKTKAHQVYKLSDGTRVKGVTTIINTNLGWNKQALIMWARKLAMAGQDPMKVRDQAADIGTVAHYLIECDLKHQTPELNQYAQCDINKAETCYLAYLEWKKAHDIEPLFIEYQLVSEKFGYGGTLDFVGNIDQKIAIMDYKTGTGVYDEAKIQAAAYQQLWEENNPADKGQVGYWLLHLGKEDGEFAPYQWNDLSRYWAIFYHLLEIDKLKNGNGNGK